MARRSFRVACDLGLEGIVAKDRERPYRSGKRPEWLKIKCIRRDNFVFLGFEPSTCRARSDGCCWPRQQQRSDEEGSNE
ncbi:ATP-dependent DNA ligase [Rhizobium giardinii]|uniref:ATP-dependent DNA ligase n=1 Tax=Rhizobium giardinii TaxID=56731 RepID=A0A7W8X973_9HYPH|nr:ATP-dependent DNA ligase [Rhizobium giardinii]